MLHENNTLRSAITPGRPAAAALSPPPADPITPRLPPAAAAAPHVHGLRKLVAPGRGECGWREQTEYHLFIVKENTAFYTVSSKVQILPYLTALFDSPLLFITTTTGTPTTAAVTTTTITKTPAVYIITLPAIKTRSSYLKRKISPLMTIPQHSITKSTNIRKLLQRQRESQHFSDTLVLQLYQDPLCVEATSLRAPRPRYPHHHKEAMHSKTPL